MKPSDRARKPLVVDGIIDSFEDELRAGRWPRIEDFVGEAPAEAVVILIRELVELEVDYRLRAGVSRAEVEAWRGAESEDDVATQVRKPADRSAGAAERRTTRSSGADTTLSVEGVRDAAEVTAATSRFRHYEIQHQLGRGGQGVVYLARDLRLGRRVALKILHDASALSPGARARFVREAEAASKLDHPGICTVYESGEEGGIPYIAMRFVEGRSLATTIAAARVQASKSKGSEDAFAAAGHGPDLCEAESSGVVALHEVLSLIEKVARALHVAHEAGLIHRDIKPANIMVSDDGQPVVLDFGLARDDTTEGATLTHTGDVLGTPAYMAPEQISGHHRAVGPRADVYALGATLYECLTLVRPFTAPTRELLYQAICTEPVEDPRHHNRRLPYDLKVILETALEKDVARRYQTALELAEELRRVREYEPIRARPLGPFLRLSRWARRNSTLAAACVTFVVVVAISLGFLFRSWRHELAAKEEALHLAEANQHLADEELAARARAEVETEAAKEVASFLVGMFQEVDPIARSGRVFGARDLSSLELSARAILDRGAAEIGRRLKSRPRVRASILDTIGNAYYGLGLSEEARPMLEEALEIRCQAPESDELCDSMESMALVRGAQGEFCSDELEAVVAMRRRLDSPPDRLARSLIHLAVQLLVEWKLEAIGPVLDEAWEVGTSVFGEEGRDAATILLTRAQWLLMSDRQKDALGPLTRAAKILDGLSGQHEFEDLVRTFVSAQIARGLGQWAVAEKVYVEGVRKGTRLVGPKHPLIAWMRADHVYTLRRSGIDAPRTARLSREVLELYREIFGEESVHVPERLLSAARCHRDAGRVEEAMDLARECEKLSEKFGDWHLGPLRQACRIRGHLHADRGEMAEAEACIRRCAAVRRIEFGDQNERTVYLIGELGDFILRRDGDVAAGKLVFGEAKRRDRGDPPPTDPEHLFDLASAFARAASLVLRDETSPDTRFFAASYEASAFDNLERAVASGFRDAQRLRAEPALAGLQGRERWDDLVSSLGR